MVKGLLKKSFNALVSKQTNIFSAAFFIAATTILSQILGVLKYRFLVIFLENPNKELGIYFASFKVPEFIFQVFIASAITSTFIPIFSDYISKDKKEDAYAFTSSLLSIGLTLYLFISIIVLIFSYQIASLIVPGASAMELTTISNLMRVIQLSQIFFILGTLETAILQSFQHFLIPGLASAFYNLGIIIGIIVFAPFLGLYGAITGALIGSILFFVIQIPLLRVSGFTFSFKLDFRNSGIIKTFQLMVPRSLSLLVGQVAAMSTLFFASIKSLESYGFFELAQILIMAPVLLIGQSIAQASFPTMSLKRENKNEFVYIFLSSFNQILYLILPISVLFIILRIPMVRLFYGAKEFNWPATVETGYILSILSLSIFAQALSNLVLRAFYVHKDTKTPFYITIISVTLYIMLSFIFIIIYKQPVYYLAFAYSFSHIISIMLLIIFLNRKIELPKIQMFFSVLKITIATLVMGIALYIPIKLLDQLVFDTTRTINLIILTGIASFMGFVSYVFFTWLLNIREALYIIRVFRKFGNWNKILKQVKELIEEPNLNP